MTSLKKFINLSLADKILILYAGLILSLVVLGLRALGVRRTQLMLGSLFRYVDMKDEKKAESVRRCSSLLDIASRRAPFVINCLERSLALWLLLRRQGIDCQIRLGARRSIGSFEAHAWVESDGIVVNDSEFAINQYTPFDCSLDYLSADH
ncbi:MAG: lasso peptide biosynthesis B2 protein [Blastocatellales bacterium]